MPLEHRLETGAQRERRLTGASPTAERDDPNSRVQQQIQRHPLLGRPAVDAEASRSALTSLSSLAGVTRPSAEPLPLSSTTPV